VQGEHLLFEVVLRLGASSSLAHLLYGGQEQADEDGDDRDHHQQLDQCKPPPAAQHSHEWHELHPWERRAIMTVLRHRSFGVNEKSASSVSFS
jgi:hypothetical protein